MPLRQWWPKETGAKVSYVSNNAGMILVGLTYGHDNDLEVLPRPSKKRLHVREEDISVIGMLVRFINDKGAISAQFVAGLRSRHNRTCIWVSATLYKCPYRHAYHPS